MFLQRQLRICFFGIEVQVFNNILERQMEVLKLIAKGEGSNQLVEKCKKKNSSLNKLVYADKARVGNLVVLDEKENK